jgi:hypothetical protein
MFIGYLTTKYAMIKKYDKFLSREDCNLLLEEVRQKQDLWSVSPLTEYRVLGNCFFHTWVKEGFDSLDNYANNQIDLKLHNIFKEKMSTLFDNVQYTRHFGKPGYSIIVPGNTKSALWHYDNELPLFPYVKEFDDYNNDFHSYFDKSYTFIIMISKGNYSFDYYPQTVSKYVNTSEGEMLNHYCKDHVKLIGDVCPNVNCDLKQYDKVNYEQGMLLIQEERFLHRASPAMFSNKNEIRVIVRGYGVLKNKRLYIFW